MNWDWEVTEIFFGLDIDLPWHELLHLIRGRMDSARPGSRTCESNKLTMSQLRRIVDKFGVNQ